MVGFTEVAFVALVTDLAAEEEVGPLEGQPVVARSVEWGSWGLFPGRLGSEVLYSAKSAVGASGFTEAALAVLGCQQSDLDLPGPVELLLELEVIVVEAPFRVSVTEHGEALAVEAALRHAFVCENVWGQCGLQDADHGCSLSNASSRLAKRLMMSRASISSGSSP